MIIKCEIDTDDIYDDGDGNFNSFEQLLTESLRRDIVQNAKGKLASDEFKRFSKLTSDTIVADIKLRMENFLSEEIALTEGWGKPTFVGSIDDLIKKRFDEILLRTVDSKGETLKGCTSQGKTWLEWRLGDLLKNQVAKEIKSAGDHLAVETNRYVKAKLVDLKDKAVKEGVDKAFTNILTK